MSARTSARAIDLLRAAWAEEGRLDAAERASRATREPRRRERVRSTRTTDDTRDERDTGHERRTQVLAAWLEDHETIYGTGEQ